MKSKQAKRALVLIMVMVLLVLSISAVALAAPAAGAPGPGAAPNSGDGIQDGSGLDSPFGDPNIDPPTPGK